MKILSLFPPNYAAINRAFKVRGKPIIFAFGNAVYNPSRIVIPPELQAHEQVHLERQAGDPWSWWARYIDDPEFRLDEEIPAHRAEYLHLYSRGHDRLVHIAARLASSLYGSLIDVDAAKAEILNGNERTARNAVSDAG